MNALQKLIIVIFMLHVQIQLEVLNVNVILVILEMVFLVKAHFSFSIFFLTNFKKNKKIKIDVNECSTQNGGCSNNAMCTNTIGGFNCTCKTGYSGDGVNCTSMFSEKKNSIN